MIRTASKVSLSLHCDRWIGEAFTLVELLVVVAVMGILVALSSAVLPGVIERGKSVRCVANLKANAAAILSYAADHDGKSVVAYLSATNSPSGSAELWHLTLIQAGYLDSRGSTLVCPSFPPFRYSKQGPNVQYTYGLRRWDDPRKYDPAYQMGRVDQLSKFVLLADSYKDAYKSQTYYITWPGFTSSAPEQIHARHNGRANIAFADGGVRALSRDEILALGDGWKPSVIKEDVQ
jgi:prepilin-type processing-associated H-X9-DG protein/prepilin-type N-terminal cleavage/methylation domain-containing protein